MLSSLYRLILSALAGCVSGVVAFGTVAVVYFAFLSYGRTTFEVAALRGLQTGLLFGPLIGLLHLSWPRAAAWQGWLVGLWYLAYQIWLTTSGIAVFPSPQEGIAFVLKGWAFYAVASAFAGAATAWIVSQLPGPDTTNTSRHSHTAAGTGGNRVYRL